MKKRLLGRAAIRRIWGLLLAGTMVVCFGMTAFAAGWEQVDGGWYYRGRSGEYLKNNWVYSEGKNYYLGADGRMLTGEHTIVYRTCKFDESGALVEEGEAVEVPGLDYADLLAAQYGSSALLAGHRKRI